MKTTSTKEKSNDEAISQKINILLADDDTADCLLFKEALDELPLNTNLTTVYNGEQLLEELENNKLPDVLFLDLNMPRKNGFVALGQIKRSTQLQNIPVVVFSTASDMESIKKVYRDAAHYYISKPADFIQLKKLIYEALVLITDKNNRIPMLDKFIIKGNSIPILDTK
ncbi:MAG: response regulator [Bacteroidia bacterium]|nr:response regulator [Bacteroidia bacterium]